MADLPYAAPGLLTRHRLGLPFSLERAYQIVPDADTLLRTGWIEYPINNGNGMMMRCVVDVQAEGRRYAFDWHKARAHIAYGIACNYHNANVIEPVESFDG